jgi:chorismate-pyruvate lyase
MAPGVFEGRFYRKLAAARRVSFYSATCVSYPPLRNPNLARYRSFPAAFFARFPVEENALHYNCDIDRLEPAMRLLLTSDGTVTDMLQAITRENIRARRLAQEVRTAVYRVDSLDLDPGELLMGRCVLLEGDRTWTNYVYAESYIAIGRLDVQFQSGLLNSDTPIGRLWRDNKVEIFKEILTVSKQPSGSLASHFGAGNDSPVIVRTSRVFMGGRPVMLITEHFSPAVADCLARENSLNALSTDSALAARGLLNQTSGVPRVL